MQENDRNLAGTDSELQKANDALKGTVEAQGTTLETLQDAVDGLQTANQELAAANQKLEAKLNALLNLLENDGKESQVLTKGADGSYSWQDAGSHASEVLTLHLEEGWNLVAMPGNAVLDESEEAILAEVEIYTYDKTEKVYLASDGLEPLTSYWMRAPKPCTIHFKTAK